MRTDRAIGAILVLKRFATKFRFARERMGCNVDSCGALMRQTTDSAMQTDPTFQCSAAASRRFTGVGELERSGYIPKGSAMERETGDAGQAINQPLIPAKVFP